MPRRARLLAAALVLAPVAAFPWRYTVQVEEHARDVIRVRAAEERRAVSLLWRPPAGARAVVVRNPGPRRWVERGGPARMDWAALWAWWAAVAAGSGAAAVVRRRAAPAPGRRAV